MSLVSQPAHSKRTILVPLLLASLCACTVEESEESEESDNGCRLFSWQVDEGANGSADRRTDYAYDSYGDRDMVVTDADMDGITDTWTDYDYSPNRRRMVAAHHSSASELVSSETYSFDPEGNRIAIYFSSGEDDQQDARYSFTYDRNGRLWMEYHDWGVDDVVDLRTTYSYDAQGRLVTSETDHALAEGPVNQRTTYAYDGDGNRILEEQDDDGSGSIDARIAYAYDVDGNMLSMEWDGGADNTVDAHNTYAYDEVGNLIFQSWWSRDGETDEAKYSYDALGNRLSEEWDKGADGTTDRVQRYTYECL